MQTTKNVLFLSYDGMTDPLGQSQVIPYLAGLTKYGYKFTILSCDKKEMYVANKSYVEKQLEPYPIRWISLPYHKNPPVLSSMYDLYQIKRTIKKLQKQEPFDLVHTRPGVPTLAAVWMKKKYSTKFLNDIRGFWADERVDGGMWNQSKLIYRRIFKFFKAHEYECLELADYNVCLTNAAKKEMMEWRNIKNQPLEIEVIPCSADLDLFDPKKISEESIVELKNQLGILPNEMVISYLGSIGGWYLTEEMMRFCKMVSDKIPNSKFLFISPHRHEAIKEAASAVGLPLHKLVIKKAARHEVPLYISLSSYSLFFIKPCYSKMSSSPTKHGEIMAMGIPVITNSGVGDVKEIVQNYDAGIILNEFSEQNFETAILAIMNNPQEDSKQIRDGAKEIYALETATTQYSKVYQEIFNGS